MSTIECFPSIFDDEAITILKKNNIRTVLDFMNETPECIGKILKLHFKDVIDIREKVVDAFRRKPSTALNLLNHICENRFSIPSGIPEIDMLIGGLENGHIYEICGLSGSGKTQLCLNIAAHASSLEKRVLFIDTKNDFSASRIFQILKKKCFKDVSTGMERIRVTKVFNLHKLVDVLHNLEKMYFSYPFPLVIVDCISTSYFAYVGGDKPIGYAMLNHVASILKYIVTKYHCILVLTNLATENFHTGNIHGVRIEKLIKPCLGSYWQQISNVRLDLKKIDCTIAVSVGKSDSIDDDTTNHIRVLSI